MLGTPRPSWVADTPTPHAASRWVVVVRWRPGMHAGGNPGRPGMHAGGNPAARARVALTTTQDEPVAEHSGVIRRGTRWIGPLNYRMKVQWRQRVRGRMGGDGEGWGGMGRSLF